MASGSEGLSRNSFDLLNGRWIVPKSVTSDPDFRLVWTAYEGRNRARFLRGETSSSNNIRLDTFLKLVTNNIRCPDIYNTLSQAITFYGFCSAVREQDFDVLKRILNFLVEYNILSEEKRSRLREEISIRIPAKRAAETARLARAQRTTQEALAQQRAEEEDEAFWNSPAVQAQVTLAETALENPSIPPSQELVVLASPEPGVPPNRPLKSIEPSRVLISAEELAIIVAFRQALDNKDRINWEAYRGLKEFDRLGLEALLDLSDLVEGDTLPSARVVPASELRPIVYTRLGGPRLSPESLRSGIFYPRR